jgi:hypothetical protein
VPSRTSVTLALAMLGGVASIAWAAEEPIEVTITEDMAWVDAVKGAQGALVTFLVAEGWDARASVDCVTLTEGSRWTFEVIDTSGERHNGDDAPAGLLSGGGRARPSA